MKYSVAEPLRNNVLGKYNNYNEKHEGVVFILMINQLLSQRLSKITILPSDTVTTVLNFLQTSSVQEFKKCFTAVQVQHDIMNCIVLQHDLDLMKT
jgi:hypothetical protein